MFFVFLNVIFLLWKEVLPTIIGRVKRNGALVTKQVTKFWMLPRAIFLVSNGNSIVAGNFTRFGTPAMWKANKLPLETEPVVHDNNKSWTFQPGHQTFSSRLTQRRIVVCKYIHVVLRQRQKHTWSISDENKRMLYYLTNWRQFFVRLSFLYLMINCIITLSKWLWKHNILTPPCWFAKISGILL